ncbi:RHS repeat-associated core domain-containing protein, partial [Methylocaldum szegediense]
NGCPIRLTDSKGEVLWAASYTAWGQIARMHVGDVDNPIRLQGQYEDGETGFHYNRHRYYESHSGQFASQDILRLIAGPNTYRFAPSTIGWIDPVGLVCLDRRVGRFRDQATGRFVAATRVRGHFPDSVTPGQRVLYRADPVTGAITHFQVYDVAGLPLKRVDIIGAAHGGVPTPHVVEFVHNVNPRTGQVFPRPNRKVRPAGPQDIL